MITFLFYSLGYYPFLTSCTSNYLQNLLSLSISSIMMDRLCNVRIRKETRMYYHTKMTTWRTYLFLILSLLTTLAMFLIDPISTNAGESVGIFIMIFIIAGCALSVLLAFVVFRTSEEKKGLASIALLLTLFNVAITLYFLWVGFRLA